MVKKSGPIFYGWLVVAISCLTLTVIYSMRYSFAVFYLAIIDEFGWSKASTAAAFSINIITYGVSAPFAGALTDLVGIRRIVPLGAMLTGLMALALSQTSSVWQLYLFFAVMAFGMCVAGYVPHSSILPNWFIRRRGTAFGMVTAGWGLAYLGAPLTNYFVSNLGWRGAYVAWAAIVVAAVVPLAFLFYRQRPEDLGLVPDGAPGPESQVVLNPNLGYDPVALVVDRDWASRDWKLDGVVRTSRFWVLFFIYLLMGMLVNMVAVHQVAYLVYIGYGLTFASFALSLVGVSSTIGNLSASISDRIGREAAFTLGCLGIALGMLLLLSIRDTSQTWLVYLFALVFGTAQGLASTTSGAIAADIFQGRNFGSINGLIVTGFGVGGAVGPWLGGYVLDVAGDYNVAFVLATVGIAICGGLSWIAAPRKVRSVAGRVARA